MSLVLQSSGGGSVTLEEPVTASNFTITVPAVTGTMITTASTFAGTGPAFSAYASTGQSISATTYTKLNFGTEEFDTNNNFASSRFTPTVAGYYQINAACNMSGQTTGGLFIQVYKNGSGFHGGNISAGSSLGTAAAVSCVVYLNGSTDYIEIYAYDSGSFTTNFGVGSTWFNGAMVRAA